MTKADTREKSVALFSGPVDLKLEILSASASTEEATYEVTGLLWVSDRFPLRLYARAGKTDLLELRVTRMCCSTKQYHSNSCLTSSELAHVVKTKKKFRLSPSMAEWFDHLVNPLEAPILSEEIGTFLKENLGKRSAMTSLRGNKADAFVLFNYIGAQGLQDARVAESCVLPPALASLKSTKWVTYELYASHCDFGIRRSRFRNGKLEVLSPTVVGRISRDTVGGSTMARLIEKHGPKLQIEAEYGSFKFYLWSEAKPKPGDWPTMISELLSLYNSPW